MPKDVLYELKSKIRIAESSRFSNEITLSLFIVAYLSGFFCKKCVHLHVKPDTPLFFQVPHALLSGIALAVSSSVLEFMLVIYLQFEFVRLMNSQSQFGKLKLVSY